ncbi:hypothetical protein GCM10018793_68340 [Streptomyces sulfonofaciens]|uniref:Uncharacterized protein n=1 Tax=Streptomyces sulfonofaciens TaxID=68272 RepID=A0A919GPL9_9ACTN|nr:hypothetical protein GCM10018793_68340 [Streptomyces sulfonofaciens]
MELRTDQVWAIPKRWQGDTARQLLVPAGTLEVADSPEGRLVHSVFGRWRTTADGTDDLTALIPDGPDGVTGWSGRRSPRTPGPAPSSPTGCGWRPAGQPWLRSASTGRSGPG